MNLDSLRTTCKCYLGEVCPFLGVLSQLQRHGLSLKIYSTVINLNIVPWIMQDKIFGRVKNEKSFLTRPFLSFSAYSAITLGLCFDVILWPVIIHITIATIATTAQNWCFFNILRPPLLLNSSVLIIAAKYAFVNSIGYVSPKFTKNIFSYLPKGRNRRAPLGREFPLPWLQKQQPFRI